MSQNKPDRGARIVTLEELAAVKAPSPEGRWHPIDHSEALRLTEAALDSGGFTVVGRELFLLRGDRRFIGMLDLEAEITERTTLVVGITSSTDQSLPFSVFAGYRSRATGCSSFRSDLFVKRKHTIGGEGRFKSEVAGAVEKLPSFVERESARAAFMESIDVEGRAGDAIILRLFEEGVIPTRVIFQAIRDWRKPPHEEFAKASYWSLANLLSAAVAQAGRKEVYRKHVRATMRLNALLDAEPELRPAD